MEFPKVVPGENPGNRSTWSNEPLKGGGVVTGWLAGPTVWVWVHRVRYSKPCRHEMTRGGLPCPICASGRLPELKGYVPFYREDGRQMFVIIPDYNADGVRGLDTHAPIRAFRGKEKGDPIRVVSDPKAPRYKCPYPERDKPARIEEALLRIWGDEGLSEWFARPSSRDDIREALARATETRTEADEAHRALTESIRRKIALRSAPAEVEGGEPVPVGDVLPEHFRPGVNGVHKPR